MPFTEICIYQVKPQRIEEFETKESYGWHKKFLRQLLEVDRKMLTSSP